MLTARLGAKMDSLLLSCTTLSFATTCRFIPAHPVIRRPRKQGRKRRYRASNPAEDDMPRPSDVAHASNGQETHFLPPSTAAMASARLVAVGGGNSASPTV